MSEHYQRLIALCRAGDEAASRSLEVEARRRGDRDAILLALFAQPPTTSRWEALCTLLSSWPEAPLEQLHQSLSTWPDELRLAPPSWLRAAAETGDAPPALVLARVIRLDYHSLQGARLERLLEALGAPTEIELVACEIGDGEAQTLAFAPGLESLESLNLFDNHITTTGALTLSVSPYLGRLKWLNLIDNSVDDVGAMGLADTLGLRGCRVVLVPVDWNDTLPIDDMTRAGWHQLCGYVSQFVPDDVAEVESINLALTRWNPDFRVSPESWTRALLAGRPHARMRLVRVLRIAHPEIPRPSMQALAGDPHLTHLHQLVIRAGHLEAPDIDLLTGARLLSLDSLVLEHQALGPEGALALAGAPYLRGLRTLAIQFARIADEGLLGLLKALEGAPLRALAVSANGLTDRAVEAIAQALPGLQSLFLFGNALTDRAAEAIAKGLPKLKVLNLRGNQLTRGGVRALSVHPNLRKVDVRANLLSPAERERLPRGWIG